MMPQIVEIDILHMRILPIRTDYGTEINFAYLYIMCYKMKSSFQLRRKYDNARYCFFGYGPDCIFRMLQL